MCEKNKFIPVLKEVFVSDPSPSGGSVHATSDLEWSGEATVNKWLQV